METGAVNETEAMVFPAIALTAVGAPGFVGTAGITALDAVDKGLFPAAFVAISVNV